MAPVLRAYSAAAAQAAAHMASSTTPAASLSRAMHLASSPAPAASPAAAHSMGVHIGPAQHLGQPRKSQVYLYTLFMTNR